MFGTIVEVRRSDRFAFLTGKDGDKYFASFKEFVNRPLGHVCMLQPGVEVEFEIASVQNDRRKLHPLAVNVLLPDVAGFPVSQVEAIIEVWNGTFGFARTMACGCSNIFVHLSSFITAPEFLIPTNLHTGSRIVADLEDTPDRPNCAARNIELFKPEES